jgi:hypothetical protein
MKAFGLALYAQCVDFLLVCARALHVTYRDANALLFFVLWPAVTVALAAIAWRQSREIRRLLER